MGSRARFTKAELERAIKAAKSQGYIVRLHASGLADIIPAESAVTTEPPAESNSCDEAFGL